MKKIGNWFIGLVLVFVFVWYGHHLYIHHPHNIFDEMYLEVNKTYRTNNILGKIEGFYIIPTWSNEEKYSKGMPFGRYIQEKLPVEYWGIGILFNFNTPRQTVAISFEREIGENIGILVWNMYYFKEKKIVRSVSIAIPNSVSADYIEEEEEVKAYLQKYGITTTDLDRYYDEVVNQKVLKDWLSIYDSQYLPTDYGDLTIETQWEDW